MNKLRYFYCRYVCNGLKMERTQGGQWIASKLKSILEAPFRKFENGQPKISIILRRRQIRCVRYFIRINFFSLYTIKNVYDTFENFLN